MHGTEFTVVVLTGLALLVGAAMRLFSQRIHFPFTIGMLLVGLLLGLWIRNTPLEEGHGVLALLDRGSDLAPGLIIFVFLPALVFESAFAVDVHQFRKNLGAVALYAGPVLIAATVITAAMVVLLTASSWQWGWITALVFGALISATDPVAVVAIFSELGVAKRLSVLVEGESLLNDGTSIVVFTLFVSLLTGELAQFSTADAILSFAVVVAGGIAVGLGFAFVFSRWIAAMFNDPLSEITLTLVLAYSCMVVAEGYLHVSGVMGVVSAGLWMSATGKRSISPETAQFLHRFWHLLGYVANTLVFFLVGLLIAKELDAAGTWDFVLIALVYVGVMLVRALVTFAAQPLAHRLSEGVNAKDSTVITWGGLRGAVSLALALLVAHNPNIDPAVRQQMLLLTAGVVLLSILVNGSSMGWVLAKLHYDRPPLFEQLAVLNARGLVLERVESRLVELSQSRDLRTVDWSDARARLEERRKQLEKDQAELQAALDAAPGHERAAGYWRQALDIERQAYWEAFANGTLSSQAVKVLDADLTRHSDRLGRGVLALQPSRTEELFGGLFNLRRRSMNFEQVAMRYDLWRAESVAAERVLLNLHTLLGCDQETLRDIRSTYEKYLHDSKEHLEDLRTNLPEMARAVETRLSRRIELNLERESFLDLEVRGVLDHTRAHAELHAVEQRMNALKRWSEQVEIPETAELVARAPLFRRLGERALRELADVTEEMLLPRGAYLFEQGDPGDALYVIARGAMEILIRSDEGDFVVDVLGGGDVVGEMALLTGAPRAAAARAATSVTLGRIDRSRFAKLIERVPELENGIWSAFAERAFDNHVRDLPRFRQLTHSERIGWFREGRFLRARAGERILIAAGERYVFVIHGSVLLDGEPIGTGVLVEGVPGSVIVVQEDSALSFLKELEARVEIRGSKRPISV